MNTMNFKDLNVESTIFMYTKDVYNGNTKKMKLSVIKKGTYGPDKLNLTYLFLSNGAEFTVPSNDDVFEFIAMIGDYDIVLRINEIELEDIDWPKKNGELI